MEAFSVSGGEAPPQVPDSTTKRGGWITFPFITAAAAGLTLASWGWTTNLIVCLIDEFHIKSIDAAQISNVVSGCTSLFPVIGAIIADSFLGCFQVVYVSSFISLLGIVLLTLSTTLHALKPLPCESGLSSCENPSNLQYAVLYAGLALASIGVGGTRYTIATMGADQFDKPKDQAIFFNWYFFTFYTSAIISATGIVFIEDNVGWGAGLGLCVAISAIVLIVFLLGKRYYRLVKPQGSPFMDIARVMVATVRKRKVEISSQTDDYYVEQYDRAKMIIQVPTKNLRFLNCAAQKTVGDTKTDGSIAKPWRLCTVQQVEDLKSLIRIFPLWSTGIFLSTPIAIQMSLTVLQALVLNRHLGPNFQIPPASVIVFTLIATSISLTIIDRFLIPKWQSLIGQTPSPLQRIGLGHVLNVLSMALGAIVESRRLHIAQTHHVAGRPGAIVPMSVLWLVPQLATVGVGEAFHFPGQVALYYQEFPVSMKSMGTAMIAMLIGIAFYLSTAVIDMIRRVTLWLPDDINEGRLDNVYWVMVVVGIVNFGYYIICARLYKYQNIEGDDEDDHLSDFN